jgi:hypothetical protein
VKGNGGGKGIKKGAHGERARGGVGWGEGSRAKEDQRCGVAV